MQSNAERFGRHPEQTSCLDRFETEHVDHHERLPIANTERPQGAREIDPLVGVIGHVGWQIWIELRPSFEDPGTRGFEEHATGDPEEPCLDRGITSEAKRRRAGPNERFLGELLGIVSVPDQTEEVGEDGLLVGPEHILKLQPTLDGLSR